MTQVEMLRKVVELANEKVIDKPNYSYSQADVKNVLTSYSEAILASMKESDDDKERITLPGLGSFAKKVIKERRGISKLGGVEKEWFSPEKREIVFKIEKSKKIIQ